MVYIYIETYGQVSVQETNKHYSNTSCNFYCIADPTSHRSCLALVSLLYQRASQNVLFFHPMEIPTLLHPTTTTQRRRNRFGSRFNRSPGPTRVYLDGHRTRSLYDNATPPTTGPPLYPTSLGTNSARSRPTYLTDYNHCITTSPPGHRHVPHRTDPVTITISYTSLTHRHCR